MIEFIFDTIKDYASVKDILAYIQDHYPKIPQHLYGKIFLYQRIYDHLKDSSVKYNKKEY